MSRGIRILGAVAVAITLVLAGMYVANPFGTATWDPRGRIFGHVPYRVPSAAMSPTLKVGDLVVATTYAYTRAGPAFPELIVFLYPKDQKTAFIKRVIGTPGDTVELRAGRLLINGEPVSEPYLDNGPGQQHFSQDLGPVRVPDGSYFVLGDNRDNSNDSRFWGPVPAALIVGRVDFVYHADPSSPADPGNE